jgi:PAS domain S-box-containing protein
MPLDDSKNDLLIKIDKLQNRIAELEMLEAKHQKNQNEIRNFDQFNHSLLFEVSFDPLVTIDLDGKVTSVNKATEKITGYPRDDIIGKEFSNIFTEPEKAKEGFQKVFKEQYVRNYPLEVQHVDGMIIPVLCTSSLYNDQIGNVGGVFTTLRNITERKKVEKQLKLAVKYNRTLIEASLDPLVTIGRTGKITDVNNATEHITGVNKEELIGTDFSDYFTKPKKAREVYERVFEKGLVRDYPLEIKHKNGHTTPVLYNASIYKDESGEVIGVFAAARDITERKKAENIKEKLLTELRRRTAIMEAVFSSMVVQVSIYDNFGNLINMNKSGKKMLGYPESELFLNFKDWVTKFNITDWDGKPIASDGTAVALALKGKTVKEYKVIVHPPNSKPIWLLGSASPIKIENNELIGVVVTFVDITKLKKAEDALKESNKELETFAYIASHDLREPLRMIKSFLELLEKRYEDKLDADAVQFINFAVDGAKRLDEMINDLLEYSRVTRTKIEFIPVDCEQVLEEVLINLKVSIDENSAIITHDLLPSINGDYNLMVQIFQNLISNAIKYRSEEAPKIHISAINESDRYLFSVKDNGIGMESKHLKRIFTVFKRLHTKDEYEGTGIGLAIVEKIVHQFGGQIWVESEPGKGSTFYFTIPK